MLIPDDVTIILICSLVAVCGALLGPFLILRRVSMMTDAISHSILFGIVLAFALFRSMDSVLMIIAAGLTGVLTVWLTELILKTQLVKEDASIGLVFPALFSLAVILLTTVPGLRDIHIDTHTALVGEVALAPFDTLVFTLGGQDVEVARSLVIMAIMAVINLVFVLLFYKELKLTTFDAGLAAALGFAPGLIHYALMGLLSVTAVTAFDAVGAVLLVAFVVVPATTAYLLTDHLWRMIVLSAGIGVAACIAGTGLAFAWDANISGSIVIVLGAIFGLTLVFAPERGLLAGTLRRRRQKWEFAEQLLVVHLLHHEATPEQRVESELDAIPAHLNWRPDFAQRIVQRADRQGWVRLAGDQIMLTDQGRRLAQQVVTR